MESQGEVTSSVTSALSACKLYETVLNHVIHTCKGNSCIQLPGNNITTPYHLKEPLLPVAFIVKNYSQMVAHICNLSIRGRSRNCKFKVSLDYMVKLLLL